MLRNNANVEREKNVQLKAFQLHTKSYILKFTFSPFDSRYLDM